MIGKIHSFHSLGTLDGPGVRFVVFLYGCHLHCGYCHNVDVCRGNFIEYTPNELIKKTLQYQDYFGENGGITISGGEPLLQSEFVAETFRLCKENGIHTVLDTSGSILNHSVHAVLDSCDLILLDLKMTTEEEYQNYIGCSLSTPLAFLHELEKRQIPCWIRHVVVGGLNDTEDNIKRLKELIHDKKCIQKIELLPFHKMCESKYKELGLPFPFAHFSEPSKEKINELNKILQDTNK